MHYSTSKWLHSDIYAIITRIAAAIISVSAFAVRYHEEELTEGQKDCLQGRCYKQRALRAHLLTDFYSN
jgi:hypothetical protein